MFEFVLDLGPLHIAITIGQPAAEAEAVEIGAYTEHAQDDDGHISLRA